MNDINVRLVREALIDALGWLDRQSAVCEEEHQVTSFNPRGCRCPAGRGLLIVQLRRALQEFGMAP